MIDWSPTDADELSPEAREYLELLLREEGVDLDETTAIPPRGPHETGAPQLSFAQQRLWFLAQLEPGSTAYNVPAALRLSGSLDVAALARSLGEVVRRHEVLRTAVRTVEGQPVAEVIELNGPFPVPTVDLSGLPPARLRGEATRLVEREELRPFDLTRAPLLRSTLVVLGPAEHLVLLTMHHIVSDGWSVGVLVREMGALYEAFRQGRPSPLPPLPIQYADFAAWQRRELTGDTLARHLGYWRERLAGAPPVIDLPGDRPRPPVRDLRGARLPVRLPSPLGDAVDTLGRVDGATPFMTLLAVTAAWLHRHGAGADLVVGSPIANRTRAELEGLIGFFANSIVLRLGLDGNPSWRHLLARTREVTLGAYEHQDLPFEKIVEELVPARDLSYNPLFQVVVALQNAPVPTLSLAGLTLGDWDLELSTARFDLALEMAEEPRWTGHIEYATDLFDAATVERMAGHLVELVRGVTENPDRRLSELPLLSPAERRHLTLEPLARVRPFPADIPLHRLFERQVARTPAAVVVSGDGGPLTYAELDERANRLAARLRRLGVGPEVRVALWLDRTVELVVGILGVLKAGGAYVPIDPSYPEDRLRFLLEDAGAPVLVSVEGLRGWLDVEGITTVLLDRLEDDDAVPSFYLTADLPESTAYVIYTSGSTGRPKGVPVSHANVARLLAATAEWFGFGADDVWTLFHSYAFDFSVWELWGALLHGGRLVVVPYWVSRSPEEFHDLLARERVTVLNQTPSAFHQLAAVDETRQQELALRWLVFGGEALEPRRLAGWFDRHGDRTPTLVNMYGITETTVHVTFRPLRRDDLERGSVIGVPIPDLYLQLLDGEREPVPLGVAGEIHVGGAGLARGYLGRPDLTAQRFVPDPFAPWPGARLYASGDLARRRADGELEYLGRADQQVKIRGFRIEPGEIEAALASLAGVREAVVVVREDTPGDRRLVAYVAGEAADLEPATLRRALHERLPEHMVPAAFVTLPALPLTPHGKVDRKALPAPEWQGAGESYLALRTPAEEILAGIWAELLGVERVGAADSFFELGGHSLLATQVMSRVRDAFGVELPLRDLFEAPVLADFAARIEAAGQAGANRGAPPLVPTPREGPMPLSFAQERFWFLDRLQPGNPAYNMPGAFELTGRLDVAAFAAALDAATWRHEVLRTVFRAVEGELSQHILPPRRVGLPVLDLAGLPEEARSTEAERLAAERFRHRFDLARGPLLDVALLRLGPERHHLVIVLHHAVCDGWSLTLLIREVQELYAAAIEGRAHSLPELPVQYADFALWQRRLVAASQQAELAWWLDRLGGEIAPLDLPTDRPRPAVQTYRGGQSTLLLPVGAAARLAAFGRAYGATLFMTLLAAIEALLHRHSGQDDILVGAPVAGRRAVETEPLIGCFLNTLVLRTDLSDEPGFRDLVARVREVTLGAYSHQDVPFEAVLANLPQQRDLSRASLFQVMVNLLNLSAPEMQLPGLALASLDAAAPLSKFDMTFYLREEAGVRVELVYNADLFDAVRMEDLLAQLEAFLDQALDRPEEPVAALSLVTAAARAVLPDPAAPLPGIWTEAIHERFAGRARLQPGRPAVTDDDGVWSYGELETAANRLSSWLREHGVGPGDRVAVYAHRSAPLALALLGTLKAGAAFVILDPAYPAARLTAVLTVATPRALLRLERAGALPTAVEDWRRESGCPDLTLPRGCATALELLAGLPGDPPGIAAGPDDPAWVTFTSGSTGVPKGVLGSHRPLSHFIAWHGERFGLTENDRFSLLSGLAHDPLLRDLFTPLCLGALLVVPPPEELTVPGRFARWMKRHGVTVAHLTPASSEVLTEARDEVTLESLRFAFFGGDVLTRRAVERLRDMAPGCACVSYYGATETPQGMGFHEVSFQDRERIPLGRGIDGVQLLVLNAAGRLAGLGELGEICIRTPYLALGYLQDETLTRERFVANPFTLAPDDRLYRTGDLGRHLPDGAVDLQGRRDAQVKIRGFRIELGEIESALGRCPGVREAVVIARQDGGGECSLAAYVVPVTGSAIAAQELRAFLRGLLPEFMVPATYTILTELPLTPNGKVNRRALPAPEQQQHSEDGSPAPRTPVEEIVAAVWAELLGLERVGAHDHFFELGGHSLLAARVMSRLRGAFGIEMPLRDLFEEPTLAGFAARVEAARGAWARRAAPHMVPITPALREGPLPLSFAQQRLWFIDQLEPGSPLYNIRVALRAEGALDAGVLELTLGEVVRRHEVLRTVYAARQGAPVQVIRPATPFALPIVDLSGLPESARERTALALADEEAGRPFDLARGPLVRCVLLRLSTTEHIAALTLHHIASDGWSMGILVREVAELYPAFGEGRPSPLPELPAQYADFAVWQHGWLDHAALEGQVEHWRQRLAGAPPQLDLPGGRPRPAVLSPRGAACQRRFSSSVLEQLRALVRRESATLFMALLAPFEALLHARTGATDLVVGTDVAGRDGRETEELIGFFINQLPLRADLTGDPTLRELLGRVRETALEAYAHQDVPFDHLVEALRVERSVQRSPVFQVKLVLQNAPWERLDLPGLTLTAVPSSTGTAQLDLHWNFAERDEELWLTVTYSTDLYDEPLIESLLDQYELWLHAFTERPEARLGEVVAELAQAERSRRAERGLELKSKGLGKLRSLRRQADSPMEA